MLKTEMFGIELAKYCITGSAMWNRNFKLSMPYLIENTNKMFRTKPFYDTDVNISIPTNMYTMKNLHQADKGVIVTVRIQ